MIITRVENARARARLVVDRRIELDPLSVNVLLDIEFEFHLEDAFLVHELGRFQEGPVQFHRLPLWGRDDLGDFEEAGLLQLLDLPIARGDRDVILVADLLHGPRSALRSDQNAFRVLVREQARDLLFSHWSRFSGDSNPIIYPVLGFDTRGSGGMRGFRRGFPDSHDRPQFRLRKATGPVPREVEQLRVRLLSVQDHGAVHAVDPEDRVGQVLELRRGGAVGGDKPHEDILRPSKGREDARHALDDLLPVHGLEGVEGHQAEERPFRLRQLELDVGPFQIRIYIRAFHVKDDSGDLGRAQGGRLEHADVRVERPRRQMRAHEFPEEVRAPFAGRHMRYPAALAHEVADHGRAQPVHVVGGDCVGDLERDDATAAESTRDPIQRVEAHAHRVLGEVLHGFPQLWLRGPEFLPDVEGRQASAVERVQVPGLLDLLSAEFLDRQYAQATPLVFRRREAHDTVAEVVEPRLSAALQDVQDVLPTCLNEVLLQDGDQARRGNPIVLSERIDGIDQDEGPFRKPLVDELVRGLELREIESEGDFEEATFHLAASDRFGLRIVTLLALHDLAFQLVEGRPRDLGLGAHFAPALQSRRLEAFLQPDELAEQRLVRYAGTEVMGRRDLAELLRQLKGERRLAGARWPFRDERVSARRIEDLDDLAGDSTDWGHPGTGSTLARPLYIRSRAASIREPDLSSPSTPRACVGTATRRIAWRDC